MAAWYWAAETPAFGEPLMPSQQSSFKGTRTVFTPCQDAMAATEGSSEGPSKMSRPWTHWYSGPERLTPWSWMVDPAPLTRRLPATWTARVPGGGGGAGTPVMGVGAGVVGFTLSVGVVGL